MKRLFPYTIFALLCWGAWEAVNGHVPAGRLLMFCVWFVLVFHLLACVGLDCEDLGKVKQSFYPLAFFSFVLGLFLVWHGWWVTAVPLFVIFLLRCGLELTRREARKSKETVSASQKSRNQDLSQEAGQRQQDAEVDRPSDPTFAVGGRDDAKAVSASRFESSAPANSCPCSDRSPEREPNPDPAQAPTYL
jgi:hypothetical protein